MEPSSRTAVARPSKQGGPADESARPEDVFEAVVTHGPINDVWRITLWANCYNEPIFSALMQEFDIGRDEFNVMSCLASSGSMSAKVICDVSGRPKNSISRAVNRLASRSLLKRVTNADDRRETFLILSKEGLNLYGKVLPKAVERQSLMLSDLTSKEREVLNAILNKLMAGRHKW
jgi:MarR family transcriptional regulator, temperature-dependent positive regulator of motility